MPLISVSRSGLKVKSFLNLICPSRVENHWHQRKVTPYVDMFPSLASSILTNQDLPTASVSISDCAIPSHNYDVRLSEDEILCRSDRPPRSSPNEISDSTFPFDVAVYAEIYCSLSNFRLLWSHRTLETRLYLKILCQRQPIDGHEREIRSEIQFLLQYA
ncbi:hypothetical protein BS47DRAFT_769756 [Hydnum rufescens UP504]|uniref:Uncharacterized protein n=1 Tax=Hydnum rufescens UP504 TaxID=1448309 RepID=A0A9P6B163_9AGAM|nr:hypothetical protein BS47DRAFT_769756 [Hydnum rufescens UP504]